MRAANPMTATTIKPSNGGKRKETDDDTMASNEEKRLGKVTKRKKKVTLTTLRTTPLATANEGNTSVMIINTSDQTGEMPDAVTSQPLASSTPEKKHAPPPQIIIIRVVRLYLLPLMTRHMLTN